MKRKVLAAALTAALLLSGCGGAASGSEAQSAGSASASTPASSAAASSEASEAARAASATGRPATAEVQMLLEGVEEMVPATLFIGDGYSIYLPDGEWQQTGSASREDFTADEFTALANDAVTLRVQPNYNSLLNGGMTLDDAYEALLSEGYLQSDDDDHMFGRSADGVTNCQYVTEAGGVIWYVDWSYPDTPEYTEGWGSRLPQIAATFEADTTV